MALDLEHNTFQRSPVQWFRRVLRNKLTMAEFQFEPSPPDAPMKSDAVRGPMLELPRWQADKDSVLTLKRTDLSAYGYFIVCALADLGKWQVLIPTTDDTDSISMDGGLYLLGRDGYPMLRAVEQGNAEIFEKILDLGQEIAVGILRRRSDDFLSAAKGNRQLEDRIRSYQIE